MNIRRPAATLVFGLIAGGVIASEYPEWVRDPILIAAFGVMLVIVDMLIGRYFRQQDEDSQKKGGGSRS